MGKTQPRFTGKNTEEMDRLLEVLYGEKMDISEVIGVLEMLRHGWLKDTLTETDLAETAYIFDIAKCTSDQEINGLPKCVDVYVAGLLRKLYEILDRIDEMIERAQSGGGYE